MQCWCVCYLTPELSGSEIPRDELTVSVDNAEKETQEREQNGGKRRRNNIKKLLDVSERLIREAGRPLTRTEIAEGMLRLNVTVHATDIPKYLGTLLWRNTDRFASVGDGYLTKQMQIGLELKKLIPTLDDKANEAKPTEDNGSGDLLR